jgi:purine-binding chemotaxis protein CheW
MTTLPAETTAPAGKYLFLELGDEEFGIEILRIHEITGTETLQRRPDLPDCAVGVQCSRGRPLPVMDLRPRLGVPSAAPRADQYVVVVEIDHRGERALAGLLTDRVNEVRRLAADRIEPAARDDDGLLAGWTRSGDRRAALLDTDRLLSTENLDLLLEAVAAVR